MGECGGEVVEMMMVRERVVECGSSGQRYWAGQRVGEWGWVVVTKGDECYHALLTPLLSPPGATLSHPPYHSFSTTLPNPKA